MDKVKSWDPPSELHDHDEATHTPVLTPVEARQGVISGRVRLVLLVSLTLVVVAFALIYVVNA